MVFFKKVKDPNRFGVAVFDKKTKKLINIEEKPQKPKSDYAQTGFYIFDNTVFSMIRNLKPSKRGELEITDVNNLYLSQNRLNFSVVKGKWYDTGTFESLLKASEEISKLNNKNARKSK